jgi:hypothetical protein
MTYKEAAMDALMCQDASNLSGVVFSFAGAMHAICDHDSALQRGTDWRNKHPIVTLFASKIAHLNRIEQCSFLEYEKADTLVRKIIAGDESAY